MRIFSYLSTLILLAVLLNDLNAQTIMVIPFYKEGGNKQLIIENDPCYRLIETQIKAFFLSKDFSLIDYRAVISRLESVTGTINLESQESIVSTLVQNAHPDIYIIADIEQLARTKPGKQKESKLTINLTAHRTFNSQNLAATILNSGWLYYDDCLGLTTKAFHDKEISGENKAGKFTESLLFKEDPEQKSVNLSIEFFVAKNASFDYFEVLTDDRILAQVINSWIEENSQNDRLQPNISDKYMLYPNLRMQLKNSNKVNSTSDIAFALLSYLKKLSFASSPQQKLKFKMATPGSNLIFTLE